MNKYLVKYKLLSRLHINYICINITNIVKNDDNGKLQAIVDFYRKYDKNIPIIAYYIGYNDIFIDDDLHIISMSLDDDYGYLIVDDILKMIDIKKDGCVLNINDNFSSIYESPYVFNKVNKLKNIKINDLKHVDDKDLIQYNNLHIINQLLDIDISNIRFNRIKYLAIFNNLKVIYHLINSSHKSLLYKYLNEYIKSEEVDLMYYLVRSSRVLYSLVKKYSVFNKSISKRDLDEINKSINLLY